MISYFQTNKFENNEIFIENFFNGRVNFLYFLKILIVFTYILIFIKKICEK